MSRPDPFDAAHYHDLWLRRLKASGLTPRKLALLAVTNPNGPDGCPDMSDHDLAEMLEMLGEHQKSLAKKGASC